MSLNLPNIHMQNINQQCTNLMKYKKEYENINMSSYKTKTELRTWLQYLDSLYEKINNQIKTVKIIIDETVEEQKKEILKCLKGKMN